jgi:hypothetical protein
MEAENQDVKNMEFRGKAIDKEDQIIFLEFGKRCSGVCSTNRWTWYFARFLGKIWRMPASY